MNLMLVQLEKGPIKNPSPSRGDVYPFSNVGDT